MNVDDDITVTLVDRAPISSFENDTGGANVPLDDWSRNICQIVVAHAEEVYNTLGMGHREAVYHNALMADLYKQASESDWIVTCEPKVPIFYKNHFVGFVVPDLVIEQGRRRFIVELKSDTAKSLESGGGMPQLQKYLRSVHASAGMLIRFGVKRMVYRVASTCEQN
jgi:GxxExxY protein